MLGGRRRVLADHMVGDQGEYTHTHTRELGCEKEKEKKNILVVMLACASFC